MINYTIAFTLINNGTRYDCYGFKRTSHGLTCLFKTPGGNWIVANGVNFFKEISNHEVNGDWNHGHYFMEHEAEARKYFKEVV